MREYRHPRSIRGRRRSCQRVFEAENIVPEKGLQLFQLQGWGDAEHAAVTIETAVRHQDVAVGIEAEEIAEGLDSDDGAGNGII